MAPEILSGQSYDRRADVWSLGCILYELCTLEAPFMSTDRNELEWAIIRRCYQ